MSSSCDPLKASCPPPPLLPGEDLVSLPDDSLSQTTEEIPFDPYELLDRIKEGAVDIRSFLLPWGNAGLMRNPLLGEVYLHVGQTTTIRTAEPVHIGPGGVIQSGLLVFDGDIGFTLVKDYAEDNPLLFRIESIRFQNGQIYMKGENLGEAAEKEELPPNSLDDNPHTSFSLLKWGINLGLWWKLGKRNERGEYNLHDFLVNQGMEKYFAGLQLRRIAEFIRDRLQRAGPASRMLSAMHPPDYHQGDMEGDLTLQGPLYENPTTGDSLEGDRLHFEIHPPVAMTEEARLDSVKLRVDHLHYENEIRDIAGEIDGLEYAIRDDFDFRRLNNFRGSGEIRWDNIRVHGPHQMEIDLGCLESTCQLPQKVAFNFDMKPAGLRVDLHNGENQIYTPNGLVLGRILPSFLNLAVDIRQTDRGWRLGKIALGGAMAVAASTLDPLRLTDTVRASADGWCALYPESEDLLSGNGSVGLECLAKGGHPIPQEKRLRGGNQIEWYTPQGELGLQMLIPGGTEAAVKGRIEKRGERISIHLSNWGSHLDLDAPRIVRAMQLHTKTIGDRPVMEDVDFVLNPDGTKELRIGHYNLDVVSDLVTPFLENPMTSRVEAGAFRALIAADGSFILDSEDPGRPNFLTTQAKGKIVIPSVSKRPFSVDDSRVQLRRVVFDYPNQRADFQGQLKIVSENTPEEFLRSLRKRGGLFRIRGASGRPQKIRTTITADHWAFGHSGVIEIISGVVDVEALDTATGKKQKVTKRLPAPAAMLSIVIPPLPPKRDEEEHSLFDKADLLRLATGLFGTIARVNRVHLEVPQNSGEIEFPIFDLPLLRNVFTASLLLPEGTTWTVDTATKPGRAAGDESVDHFVLYPTGPLRVCGKVAGFCVTQEELKFKKIELVTRDPIPSDFDFTRFQYDDEQRARAGELILDVNTGLAPDPIEKLLDLAHIDRDLAEKNGLKFEQHRWRLPLSLDQLEKIFTAVLPEVKGLPDSGHPIPPVRLKETTGQIDLVMDGTPFEICPEREGLHPHLFVQMEPGTRFQVWRSRGGDPIRMRSFRVPFIGTTFHEDHPGARVRPHPFSDVNFFKAPFFLGVRDLQVEHPVIDFRQGRIDAVVRAREIPFRVGRAQGPYYWSGRFSNLVGQRFSFSQSEEKDPFDSSGRVVPVSKLETDRSSYEFQFEKQRGLTGHRNDFYPVVFSGTPSFTGLYSLLYPDRLLIGYQSVRDHIFFDGPHFKVKVHYTAHDAFLATQLTDDIAASDVLAYIPSIKLEEGEMTLASGTLRIAKPSTTRDFTLIVQDDQARFSAGALDVWLSGVTPSFVSALGLPEGFSLQNLIFNEVHMKGEVGEVDDERGHHSSRVQKGDLDLYGEIEFTADGDVQLSYESEGLKVNQFSSPIEVQIGNLTHLKTSGGQLEEMQFSDADLVLNDLDATLAIQNFFKTHLRSFPDLDGLPVSKCHFHVDSGDIRIHRTSQGSKPQVTVSLEGVSLGFEGRSIDSEMLFGKGGKGVRIRYPDLRITVDASGSVVAHRNGGGEWEDDATIDTLRLRIPFKNATIQK